MAGRVAETFGRGASPAMVAFKYAIFAAVAAGCNFGFQAISDNVYDGKAAILVSLAAGTAVGLVVKYVLDRSFIFYDRTSGMTSQGWQFVRYASTGVITTALFWAFELAAAHLSGSVRVRYVGGAVGLAICYWLKYRMDRRLVFRNAESETPDDEA